MADPQDGVATGPDHISPDEYTTPPAGQSAEELVDCPLDPSRRWEVWLAEVSMGTGDRGRRWSCDVMLNGIPVAHSSPIFGSAEHALRIGALHIRRLRGAGLVLRQSQLPRGSILVLDHHEAKAVECVPCGGLGEIWGPLDRPGLICRRCSGLGEHGPIPEVLG